MYFTYLFWFITLFRILPHKYINSIFLILLLNLQFKRKNVSSNLF